MSPLSSYPWPLPASPLKVISFNMQFGQVWDPDDPDGAPVDLDRAIEAVREQDADIVFLQEVEHVEPEKGQVHPPPNLTRISEALPGYESAFFYPVAAKRELPFGYGQAILCRTPLHAPEKIDLVRSDIYFDFRGEIYNTVERLLIGARTVVDGREIQLYNTHLQAYFMIPADGEAYPGQRDQVAALLRASSLPTILGGDFNIAPTDTTLGVLEDTGFRTAQKEVVTWKRLPYIPDHIFFNDPFDLVSCQVCPTDASDHDIVAVELELR